MFKDRRVLQVLDRRARRARRVQSALRVRVARDLAESAQPGHRVQRDPQAQQAVGPVLESAQLAQQVPMALPARLVLQAHPAVRRVLKALRVRWVQPARPDLKVRKDLQALTELMGLMVRTEQPVPPVQPVRRGAVPVLAQLVQPDP